MRFNKLIPTVNYFLAVIAFLVIPASTGFGATQEMVLHRFEAKPAALPDSRLISDASGNLYGTSSGPDTLCPKLCGAVFELERSSGGWTYHVLHTFERNADGQNPVGGLVFDALGNLYGTTLQGGSACLGLYGGCGTVFRLTPTSNGSWTYTVLYRFTGADGADPSGDLAIDASGNLYGTTYWGGMLSCQPGGGVGCGTVFELSPVSGGWNEKVLYSFTGGSDGGEPLAGVTLDADGNLYGGTAVGGVLNCSFGCGTVFELSPGSSGWTESVLYSFTGASDGMFSDSGLIFDAKSNLFGTARGGGSTNCIGYPNGCGTVFELVPSGGKWSFTLLYDFTGTDGWSPCGLVFDTQGDLYGMTTLGGSGNGNVFELSPKVGGGWAESTVYDFTGLKDGGQPAPDASLILDTAGNLYGTAYVGGKKRSYNGLGVVFEIVP
jgi:uncharacterized repeat protein (TIGR03803 family)